MQTFDLEADGLRALNAALHAQSQDTNQTAWEVVNAKGSHAIAVGLAAPIEVTVKGSTGYYCGGMNKQATINIHGSAGPGVGAARSASAARAAPPQGAARGGTS